MVTKDRILTISSEVGVWDCKPEDVVKKGQVKPGQIVTVDLHNGELLLPEDDIDAILKNAQPYRQWIRHNARHLEISLEERLHHADHGPATAGPPAKAVWPEL